MFLGHANVPVQKWKVIENSWNFCNTALQLNKEKTSTFRDSKFMLDLANTRKQSHQEVHLADVPELSIISAEGVVVNVQIKKNKKSERFKEYMLA